MAAATPALPEAILRISESTVRPQAVEAAADTRLSPNDRIAPNCLTRTLFWYRVPEGLSLAELEVLEDKLKAAVQSLVNRLPVFCGELDVASGVVKARGDGGPGVAVILQDAHTSVSFDKIAASDFAVADMLPGLSYPSYLWSPGDPLLRLYLTRIAGGCVLGVAGHHMLCDGGGQFNVVRELANAMRGAPPAVELYGDRSRMQATGAGATREHPEYHVVPKAAPTPAPQPAPGDGAAGATDGAPEAASPPKPVVAAPFVMPAMTVECLRVSKAGLAKAKRDVAGLVAATEPAGTGDPSGAAAVPMPCGAASPASPTGPALSTNDLVSALLWRAVTRARGLKDVESRFGFACDGRGRMAPPLPAGYIGNVNVWPLLVENASTLLGAPLRELAASVRRATASIDDRHVRSSLEWLAAQPDPTAVRPSFGSTLTANFAMTNWSRFPMYEVDIGLGAPAAVRLPAAPMDGLCIVLPPLPAHTETDALSLLLGLRSDQWAALAADPELAAYGIAVPADAKPVPL